MTLDQLSFHVGSLLANFQSLELSVRTVLQAIPGARPIGMPTTEDVYSSPVGSRLPVSELTSDDSLGELIDRFNKEASRRSFGTIDHGLVELRDALVHGRISAPVTSDTLRLVRFSEPKWGRVRVTFNALLTEEWFGVQRERIIDGVCHALNLRVLLKYP